MRKVKRECSFRTSISKQKSFSLHKFTSIICNEQNSKNKRQHLHYVNILCMKKSIFRLIQLVRLASSFSCIFLLLFLAFSLFFSFFSFVILCWLLFKMSLIFCCCFTNSFFLINFYNEAEP